jgi:hypothetical protein
MIEAVRKVNRSFVNTTVYLSSIGVASAASGAIRLFSINGGHGYLYVPAEFLSTLCTRIKDHQPDVPLYEHESTTVTVSTAGDCYIITGKKT